MPVKLYNHSGIPDKPLARLLNAAMRLAGAKGGVVVKVTRGGRGGGSYARQANVVYDWWLSKRRAKRGADGKRELGGSIATSGGYVVMQPGLSSDPLYTAEAFFHTAVHEFSHIYDYQHGGTFALAWSRRGAGGRRPNWEKRPEEVRAINRTDEALARLTKQPERKARINELILALGIEFEART